MNKEVVTQITTSLLFSHHRAPKQTSYVPAEEADERTYILNTSSKKFHYPECGSVDHMSEKNKQTVTTTRDDLIAQGYDPCGACKP